MLALLIVIGFAVCPDDPLLLRINPHPFWIIILLVTVRYGSPAGPLSAAVCAALQVGGLWHREGSLGQVFETGGWNVTLPLLYIGVAFVIGESVESRIQLTAYLNRQIDDLRTRVVASEKHRTEVETAYRQLESRVASQPNTFITLYDSARRLDSLDDKEIQAGLVEVLRDHLNVEHYGVWLRDANGAWHRTAPDGADDAPLPKLGQKAAQDNAVVSVHDLFTQVGLKAEDGILAGPLRNASGDVNGVVVVEAMSFVGFTRTMVKVFELLLDWTSRARNRAHDIAEARTQNVQNSALGVRTETYLRTRAEEDLALAARQKAPASLLLCRVKQPLPPETHRLVMTVLARIFRDMTRASDCVAYFDKKPVLVMFLPDATSQDADVVRRKLERAVQNLNLCPTGDEHPLELQWGHSTRSERSDLDELIRNAYEAVEGTKP
jgi:GGDEF domain-containing protein